MDGVKSSKGRGKEKGRGKAEGIKGYPVEIKDEEGDNEDGEETQENGYCHFNVTGSEELFSITLFDTQLSFHQLPNSRHIGHGAVVWDAAVIFAKYIEYSPRDYSIEKVAGKRLIELGSGPGLAGIAMMMRGAKCTLTDLEIVTTSLTEENANDMYNMCKASLYTSSFELTKPEVMPLDWTKHYQVPSESYDFILLTDCVFSPQLAEPLVSQLLRLSNRKTEIICCHEIRDEEANAAFIQEMQKYFIIKRVPKNKLHPEYMNDLVEILKCKLKRH